MTWTRREFLYVSAAAAGMPRWRRDADTVVRGALLYDGTGAPPRRVDIALSGDRIEAVGRSLSTVGANVIDARRLAAAPGFVDIHSHTDTELLVNPTADSKLRQGVTTEVTGQDGSSMGPWPVERARETERQYRERLGINARLGTVADFMALIAQRGSAVNMLSMVGHGTVRSTVIGDVDRPATPTELEQMGRLVREALVAGACGLSTGLEYVPGGFADLQELVTLARELRPYDLPYASHMRNEDDALLAAVEEALTIGRLAGVPVHISHLKAQGQRNWWKRGEVLRILESVRREGLDVTYDRYPYVAYSTGLSSLFPLWARDGGNEQLLRRLDDAQAAARIELDVRQKIDQLGDWDAVQITSTNNDTLRWAEGQRLGALAARRGVEPYALLIELTRGDGGRSGMVGFGMSEENTAAFLAHPLGMISSDGSALATEGPLASGTPHPRNFGTFARVLGHYCRDRKLMPLETAIHKMTAMPARRVRLAGRGVIAVGAYADLVLFDPDVVADRATFATPHRYAVGVHHVWVNGVAVLTDGEPTGALPGRTLRPTSP